MSFCNVCLAAQLLVWFGAHSFTSILGFWNCMIFSCGPSGLKFHRGAESARSCHPVGGNHRPGRVRFRLARSMPEQNYRADDVHFPITFSLPRVRVHEPDATRMRQPQVHFRSSQATPHESRGATWIDSKRARSRFELAACSARVERPSVYGPCRVSGGWGLPSLGGTPACRQLLVSLLF